MPSRGHGNGGAEIAGPDPASLLEGLALPRLWLLLAAGASLLLAVPLLPSGPAGTAALVAGVTLACLSLGLALMRAGARRLSVWREAALVSLVGQDAAPCFATDSLGRITFRNAAARRRLPDGTKGGADTLVRALGDLFSSPASVVYRLQARAVGAGHAREDVVTRRGHSRLSVHRLAAGRFLWRLEDFLDRPPPGRGAEGLSLPMLVANKQGVILFSNEAMRRVLGGRPKRLAQVFTDLNLKSGEEVAVTTAEGPVRAILAEVEGTGERREIFLLPVPDRPTAPVTAADFEAVPLALLKLTAEGALAEANAAAREIIPAAAGPGTPFHSLFEGLGRPVSDWIADVASDRLPPGSEVLRPCGGEGFVQVTLRRILDRGRPGLLAVLQDATAAKRLEEQVVQGQKMQAIGQLAGGIAHDFNNLLTAISGHCDLLLLRHQREDADYADLSQIHQNANRAAALVGQLLAFSRKQTLKPERLDLQEVLSDHAHLLNRLVGERVRLRLVHAADLGPVRADKRQFEQVVMNLVVNARDAMPEGGTVRIETEAVTLKEALRRDRASVPAGDYAVIRVSDTGTGIPPDRIEKIFEPFYTTKRAGEGTGLGLSTVYGIVKQSGGYVFVDSTPGEGSVFSLWFPVYEGQPDEAEAPPRRPIVLKQGEGVVLLVEDEAPVRAFASRALRMRGYTVLEAECAEEALALLQDPALEVDIFVTDVVMPGMDGPSWVAEALKTRPDVRVVFVSGYAEDSLSEDQLRIPNAVFLPKPFSLTDLAATVQRQLH